VVLIQTPRGHRSTYKALFTNMSTMDYELADIQLYICNLSVGSSGPSDSSNPSDGLRTLFDAKVLTRMGPG